MMDVGFIQKSNVITHILHNYEIMSNVILLHDDLLATGGTMAAAYRLVKRCGAKDIFVNFIIELEDLKGRNAFPEQVEIKTLLKL